jgi:hypothetical protein
LKAVFVARSLLAYGFKCGEKYLSPEKNRDKQKGDRKKSI